MKEQLTAQPHSGKENEMDEKRKEELVNILKMFDEASLANQKYILGYAEGYVAGLGMKA